MQMSILYNLFLASFPRFIEEYTPLHFGGTLEVTLRVLWDYFEGTFRVVWGFGRYLIGPLGSTLWSL